MTIILLLAVGAIYSGSLVTSSIYAQVTTHVVLNEVEMDPPGPNFGKQWIEFYNPTNSNVDASGWQLRATSGSVLRIQTSMIIAARGYMLLTLSRDTLTNGGDSITLSDGRGNIIDNTPSLRDVSDNNLTWQRFPNGLDTGSINDWRFAQTTEGMTNGKFVTQITLSSPTTFATYGDLIALSGKINQTRHVAIHLLIKSNSSTTNQTVTTLNDGTFTYTWLPNQAGSHSVTALWNGDALYNSAISSTITIFVDRLTTKITMYPTSLNLTEIAPVTFTGTISSHVPQAPVIIIIRAPNETVQMKTVNTFDNGSFRFIFLPSGVGTWKLSASWSGDSNHYGDQSVRSTVTISPVLMPSLSILVLELTTIPITVAVAILVYKYAATPLRLPLGQILKRRAPPHLRPLKVLNGAICPICFRPMMYEPKGADWHCERCGVYYES